MVERQKTLSIVHYNNVVERLNYFNVFTGAKQPNGPTRTGAMRTPL